MKRTIIVLLMLAAIGAGLLWRKGERHSAPLEPLVAKDEPAHESHDVGVVTLDEAAQKRLGLVLARPSGAQLRSELKGYGRVLDPAPLSSLMNEWATAQAASIASSNEWVRLRALAAQQNASERALQTAQAASLRDALAVQSAKDRLVLRWGRGVAEQADLLAFVQSLTMQTTALVRIDLPVGESLAAPPQNTRIYTLAGREWDADFLGTSSHVDPQTLGRGAIVVIKSDGTGLMAGEPVLGRLELPSEPIPAALVPSQAVLRVEGRTWVYRVGDGQTNFVRTEIALDHPRAGGWCVTNGVSTNDLLVLTGAQALLSEELKASLKSE
jgi:hypothetical protein